MTNRDARRGDLRARLEAAYKVSAPPHQWRESASTDACMVCGLERVHPIHDENIVVADSQEYTGVMIALFPSLDVADQLVVKGGEKAEQLHLTLAYLGDKSNVANVDGLLELVRQFAQTYGRVLTGDVSGMGVFANPDGAVTYASVDVPDLPAFRQALVELLDANGFEVAKNHGFTPHMTLAYADKRNVKITNVPLTFDAITVAAGGERTSFPLDAPETAAGTASSVSEDDNDGPSDAPAQKNPNPKAERPHAYVSPAGETNYNGAFPPCDLCGQDQNALIHNGTGVEDLVDSGTVVTHAPKLVPKVEQVTSREEVVSNAETVEPVRAFVSTLNGHTLITAPASTFERQWEKALTPNPHMLWMEGRFVGGEKANRNGAFWSTGDLEMGEPTVRYGPLNWLHEARHVIGVLADSRLMSYDMETEREIKEPYIQVAAGIWRWVYPDEAQVVEQASEAEKLWYSMECISAQVQCVGDNGCGAIANYGDYVHQMGGSCQHMAERSATRRFVNPTFLGGAIIVPPVRPGWANADARVMQKAAEMAELAFDQAGKPDLTASEWEQMMANVVKYAEML